MFVECRQKNCSLSSNIYFFVLTKSMPGSVAGFFQISYLLF